MNTIYEGKRVKVYQDSHSVGVVLMSRDEEYPGCKLVISGFGRSVWITLPEVIKPHQHKVQAGSWDAATVARMGRDWYWQTERRKFGLALLFGDHLVLHYGRDDMNTHRPQRASCFLPWKQWEHVRHSAYDLDGNWLIDFSNDVREMIPQRDATPKASFYFADYDGEVIRATCHIDEREWRRGLRHFRWLRLFYRPMIKRNLEISFSAEVGPKKGSWNGGMVGHSTELTPGELHEAAFRRYCTEKRLTYIGPTKEAVAA
jgi:hypothetical protein